MTSHPLNEPIIPHDDYHNKEYHLTQDEEQVLFKSKQLNGKKPIQLEWDIQMITKRQKFNFWEEMYTDLDGNPNTLEHLKTCFEKNVSKSNYDVLCVPTVSYTQLRNFHVVRRRYLSISLNTIKWNVLT